MPSVSAKQAKLMAIAAHTPSGYDGVPQAVGREFHEADKMKKGKKHISANCPMCRAEKRK